MWVRMKPYSSSSTRSRRVTCSSVSEARATSLVRARPAAAPAASCAASPARRNGSCACVVPLGRQPLQQRVVLDLVGQRVLDQLELDTGQHIFIILQLRLDRGQLVPEEPVALRADAAEVVVQPEGVEPADVAVVEKLLDLGEVALGAIGQGALLFQRGAAAGRPGPARS